MWTGRLADHRGGRVERRENRDLVFGRMEGGVWLAIGISSAREDELCGELINELHC